MHAGLSLEKKTPVRIIKSARDRHGKPGFINGELPRPPHIKKVLVYHFRERDGELLVSLIPVKNVVPIRERQLELVL